MVKRHVRVYIEGGAEGREANNDFRRGWKKFLYELHKRAMENGFHFKMPCRSSLKKVSIKNCFPQQI
jgi:hypothetical protein